MSAATALDQYLVTNGCRGCDDLKSGLRQLSFAFKASVMTDPAYAGTSIASGLNMSSMLAMTGFGPTTNAALSAVLGATRQSEQVSCTDDSGNCLGNYSTPSTPVGGDALGAKVSQLFKQMGGYLPQGDILLMVKQAIEDFFKSLPASTPTQATPTPAAPAPATSSASQVKTAVTVGTIVTVGIIAATVIGGGIYLLYRSEEKRQREELRQGYRYTDATTRMFFK